MPKEFLKVSTEKSDFRLYPFPFSHAIVIPQARNPRLRTDRASHFPIRHWKNVSIELEYITAAGGRGDPGRIRPVRGSFYVSSSSYTQPRVATTPRASKRHSSHLFVHEPCTGSRMRKYFFLSTSRNSDVWEDTRSLGTMGSLWARQIYRRGKTPARARQ